MSARLDWARDKHGERIAAGRSPIHGWGVFARAKLFSGDFVIEYCGERLRLPVANRREEKVYGTKVGIGTYIFRVDNHTGENNTDSLPHSSSLALLCLAWSWHSFSACH